MVNERRWSLWAHKRIGKDCDCGAGVGARNLPPIFNEENVDEIQNCNRGPAGAGELGREAICEWAARGSLQTLPAELGSGFKTGELHAKTRSGRYDDGPGDKGKGGGVYPSILSI